jgi:hypothetical protein
MKDEGGRMSYQNLPSELIENLYDPRARHRLGRMLDSLVGAVSAEARPVEYAQMWADDVAQVVTVASAGVVYAVGGGLTGGLHSAAFSFENARELRCTTPGRYQVTWSMSVRPGSNGDTVAGTVMINSTGLHTCEGSAYFQNAGRPLCLSGTGLIDLVMNDVVKLAVENETSASNITIDHANLVILRVT